jgi:methylmalonyl-CoA mutase
MSKVLFNQFDSVSAKAWKQKIQSDLKGADYNETLIWKSLEGIDVKPFYHSEDLINKDSFEALPISTWKVCQDIFVSNENLANTSAKSFINKGAESIRFIIPIKEINIRALLKDINVPVYIDLKFLSVDFVKELNDFAGNKNVDVYLETDIIGNLARSGNWYHNLKEDHRLLEEISKNSFNLKSWLSIDVSLYQNSGANSIQQLAYALSHVNEYLNHFDENIPKPIVFKNAVGSNYFFEIAKVKALRVLWDSLVAEYTGKQIDCIITSKPSTRNKTLYDYNTNLLRSTTECMSAILGGSDTVSNLSYDAIYHKENEFGERIARNQLLILKHESYFNQVSNPTEGAYYIEELTSQLATNSLALFKDIEANGGFLKQLKEGTIQRKIKESANKEQELFDEGKIVLLGTNKYQNEKDSMKEALEIDPFVIKEVRKTLIGPIIEKRLAEDNEKKRLKNENIKKH